MSKQIKLVTIEGPFPAGRLVPSVPGPKGFLPKAQRFLNWSEDAETGKPFGKQFTAEVPDIQHYRELIDAGLIQVVAARAPVAPKAKKE